MHDKCNRAHLKVATVIESTPVLWSVQERLRNLVVAFTVVLIFMRGSLHVHVDYALFTQTLIVTLILSFLCKVLNNSSQNAEKAFTAHFSTADSSPR